MSMYGRNPALLRHKRNGHHGQSLRRSETRNRDMPRKSQPVGGAFTLAIKKIESQVVLADIAARENDGTPELCFASRSDFRDWLRENAETSGDVWLVFGKTKEVKTLTANDALEEARQRDFAKIVDRLNQNLKPM